MSGPLAKSKKRLLQRYFLFFVSMPNLPALLRWKLSSTASLAQLAQERREQMSTISARTVLQEKHVRTWLWIAESNVERASLAHLAIPGVSVLGVADRMMVAQIQTYVCARVHYNYAGRIWVLNYFRGACVQLRLLNQRHANHKV